MSDCGTPSAWASLSVSQVVRPWASEEPGLGPGSLWCALGASQVLTEATTHNSHLEVCLESQLNPSILSLFMSRGQMRQVTYLCGFN